MLLAAESLVSILTVKPIIGDFGANEFVLDGTFIVPINFFTEEDVSLGVLSIVDGGLLVSPPSLSLKMKRFRRFMSIGTILLEENDVVRD